MKIAILAVFGWILIGCGAAAPSISGPQFLDDGCRDWVHDASGGVTWDPNDDEEGIKTFTGSVEGSDFFAFRGAGIVDAPIAKVANVFLETDRHSEWVPNFGGMRVIRDASENEKIIYRHVLTPAVIDDRDFVVNVKFHEDEKSGHLLIEIESVTDKEVPPNEDKVRGIIHKGSGYRMWPVDGGKRTMVVFTIHVDPRGDVPAWIVNLFQDASPLNNIKNIRKQAAKPDVKEHVEVKKVFADFTPKCGAEKNPITASKKPAIKPVKAEEKPAEEKPAEEKPADDAGDTKPEASPTASDAAATEKTAPEKTAGDKTDATAAPKP